MMNKFFIAATATILLSSGAAYASGADKAQWGYTGKGGPEHWGSLSPEFATCSTGKEQSPIDVPNAEGGAVKTNYNDTKMNVVNNGHTIQLNYAAGSTLQSEGAEYDLLQFHFHSPSEHTLEGKSFPLEVHFVHKAQNGTLAVVGVMFEEGAENAELAKIWKNMPEKANEVITSDVTVNAGNLLPVDQTVIRYAGSLTTPPCSEGVKWHVMTSPIEVSKEQVEKFLSTVPANNRPLQPLNDRSFKAPEHKHSH
ncbi:MAG: carbonic anhydrase family protein [Emcibacter sp.]|nr:carbonic anhydrase family protein [Emcibacter sp.]